MLPLRHLLLVLFVILAPAAAAKAAPIVVGQVSAFDYAAFGPSITLFNDSDVAPELAPGQPFSRLSVALFDAVGATLAAYDLDILPAASSWTPTAVGLVPDYGVVSRIAVAVTFRKQVLTATLQACPAGDTGDGCLAEVLIPRTAGVDCETDPGQCEAMRTGGAVLTYVPPDRPLPEPRPLALWLIGGLVLLGRVFWRS